MRWPILLLLVFLSSISRAADWDPKQLSPICVWYFYVESFEYRSRCGPPVGDEALAGYGEARRILETYFSRHPETQNDHLDRYLADMRRLWDRGARRCDDEASPLGWLFDRMTTPEAVAAIPAALDSHADPFDGACL